jgi:hypothetical protein
MTQHHSTPRERLPLPSLGLAPLPLLLLLVAAAPALAAEPCGAPGTLSAAAPNILTIGDSISMCGYGYGHFVNDMLVNQTDNGLGHGTLAGYSSACGQMASSNDGAAKMTKCIGNTTGTLKPKTFSVITYNAGLHDCDTSERVEPEAYRANVKAVLETLKPAAHAVAFTTTTPFDINLAKPDADAGINMSCVVQYNEIAKEVAAEVGGVTVIDLYAHVEKFCGQGIPNGKGGAPLLPASSGFLHAQLHRLRGPEQWFALFHKRAAALGPAVHRSENGFLFHGYIGTEMIILPRHAGQHRENSPKERAPF